MQNRTAILMTEPLFEYLDWPAPPWVKACYTLRGAIDKSQPFKTFNYGLHVGDDADTVHQHRKLLMQSLKVKSISWLTQVHGTNTHVIIKENCGFAIEADASYTQAANRACCVMTADCLPVFFCDTQQKIVAIAHAGWRGLADGVLENTVAQFSKPQHILAYLGPAISQPHFEVGEDVFNAFSRQGVEFEAAFHKTDIKQKWMADLYTLAKIKLEKMGVVSVYGGNRCTFSEADTFYSYRRDKVTGRMANLIWIDP